MLNALYGEGGWPLTEEPVVPIWQEASLFVLVMSLVYVGARRCERWHGSAWWTVLLFAAGVTVLGSAVAHVFLSGPPDIALELAVGGLCALGAWIINSRRLARR